MTGSKRRPANPNRAWTPWFISLALVLLGGGFSILSDVPGALAQNGNAATIANLRGQIQRYGCNLPQYATSVAGCRSLHARMKTLQSGTSASRSTRKPYSTSARYNSSAYSSRRTPRPRTPQSSSGGGIFGSLFDGWGSSTSRSSSRYNSNGYNSNGTSYQGLGGWSDTYPSYMRSTGRYRTLCVRTCDGYYWPVSFSTTRSGIARDANQCKSSCQVPAKLFYHRNPGADVQQMVDLQGKPYSSMENAYRYREEYVQNCRCNPEPWSEAAKEVYEQRAEQAENPEQVKTAENAANGNSAAIKTSNGTGYPVTAYPGGYYPRPAPRRRSRTGYRANDPEHMDRWWAGSW